jgi:UDP-N-acetylglucosamine 2-epimerase
MYDAVLHFAREARERSRVLEELGLAAGGYYLATVHRAQNTDDSCNLMSIISALVRLDAPVVLPLHPRARARLAVLPAAMDLLKGSSVRLVEPRGYLDMLRLEESARVILTDSGGVQKEAFFFRVPCVTLRDETEWLETVDTGWNVLAGAGTDAILAAAHGAREPAGDPPALFGEGDAARRIAEVLRASAGSSDR